MADIRRGFGDEATRGERLPWLEPVEDEYEPEPAGMGAIAIIGLALLVLIGLGIGGFVAFRHWSASRTDVGQVLRAPPGPYKERPVDPGGLRIDANGTVAEHTGTGGDIDAPLDLAALPERPVTGPGSEAGSAEPIVPTPAARPAARTSTQSSGAASGAQQSAALAPPPLASAAVRSPAPAPVPAPVLAPVPATVRALPAPAPEPIVARSASASGSGTIQLGALSSEAKAKQVWKAMASRFAFLAPLAMSITPVKIGEVTFYRLRASGGDARTLCGRLKVAGEACTVVSG